MGMVEGFCKENYGNAVIQEVLHLDCNLKPLVFSKRFPI